MMILAGKFNKISLFILSSKLYTFVQQDFEIFYTLNKNIKFQESASRLRNLTVAFWVDFLKPGNFELLERLTNPNIRSAFADCLAEIGPGRTIHYMSKDISFQINKLTAGFRISQKYKKSISLSSALN